MFIDLDETLIHSCHLRENPEIVLNIGDKKVVNNFDFPVKYVSFRLDLTLDHIAKNFLKKLVNIMKFSYLQHLQKLMLRLL